MPGLLEPQQLRSVDLAWRRAIRTDPLLSRVSLPDLRALLDGFNEALGGESVEPLTDACESLVRDADLEPATAIQIASLLAATFADELGTQSGATTKSLVATLGYGCQLLASTMVGDAEARARRDPGTGLENRLAWTEEVDRLLKDGDSFTHALLDLDGLKQINDNQSHAAGDLYLREFATHVRTSLPDGPDAPRVYRIGGDEFVVIFQHDDVAAARQTLSNIREQTEKPFSFGIAVAPHEGSDWTTLYEVSDARMYEEKRARKAGRAGEETASELPEHDPRDHSNRADGGQDEEPHEDGAGAIANGS